MKKTLIAMATLSTILAANARPNVGVTSSAELINGGNTLLIDKRTSVKKYPEISVENSLRGSGINIKDVPQITEVQTIETVKTTVTEEVREINGYQEPVKPMNDVIQVVQPEAEPKKDAIVKRTGEITIEQAKDGYHPATTEKVYTKTFLGIPYAPVDVVVEPAKPIFFGHLHFNNLTCSTGYNSGKIDLYTTETESVIPIVFCPNDTEAKIALNVKTFTDDTNKAVILLGGQKINVERGYTTLYNLRFNDNNVVNLEFIYERDEHPIRY